MRTTIAAIVIAMFASTAAEARGCVDGERVFADVPAEHPFCEEIESLYRDGITQGCGTEVTSARVTCEDGTDGGECYAEEVVIRYFCPNESITRGMVAVFVQHRDPFAMVSYDGKLKIGDHVADVERLNQGLYAVRFTRDVQRCSIEAWSQYLHSSSVRVLAALAWGSVDTMEVETTVGGAPADIWFNLRLHCK